jgi:DNA-binding NtrC family response regulator
MRTKIRVLLIHPNDESFHWLEMALQQQGIQAWHAKGCRQAQAIFDQPDPPQIVFTDTTLADGTWEDIVNLAGKACTPVPVIVVSRSLDVGLYIKVLEEGAFDFIVPPISASDLAHIVRCATDRRSDCRQANRRAAVA